MLETFQNKMIQEKKVHNNSQMMRVSPEFYNTIEHFRKKYEEIHGITISQTKATKIVDIKIKSVGGLKI